MVAVAAASTVARETRPVTRTARAVALFMFFLLEGTKS
jgi:hypothetical protein